MSVNREQLRLVGPYHSHSGYSHFARNALRCALVAGFEVEAVESDMGTRMTRMTDGRTIHEAVMPTATIQMPDCQQKDLNAALATRVDRDAPTLLIQIPPNLGAWSKFGRSPLIGWSMTESDNLVPLWQHNMRCVDLLLAPTSYCLDTCRRVLPEVPAVRVPIPVDERMWSPDEFKGEVHGRPGFLFFSAFQTSERKHWRALAQAFAEEFAGEDVGLFLKPSRWPEVEQLAHCCRQMGAWVYVDPEPCTDWILGGLYRSCDVYVQPSCEGFGLAPVEAGLCGRPSVALSLGGAADVVDEDCGYSVPSHMAPIIGHQPHWYPRTHNMATCSVDDLRVTLRRAYEQEKRSSKGETARARMMERFSAEAVAPVLKAAVATAISIHAASKLYSVPPPKPRWATAAGAWGDIFCCVGNILIMMCARAIDRIGVIYAGKDARIVEWLQSQRWCREVVHINAPDKPALDRMFGRLSQCRPVHGQAEFRRLAAEAGIEIAEGEIAYTHLTMNAPQSPQYWHGGTLPEEARAWAREHAPDGEFLLLNPLSIASNQYHDHWPYWTEAMEWVIEQATVPVVLVSEQQIEWPTRPNLVNLTGQSRTMMDVLALAELSAGIVSTSNNLGIYAPIADIQSVIVCARTCHDESIYYAWMEREPVSLLGYGASLGMMQEATRKRFSRFLKPAPKMRRESRKKTVREAVTAQ